MANGIDQDMSITMDDIIAEAQKLPSVSRPTIEQAVPQITQPAQLPQLEGGVPQVSPTSLQAAPQVTAPQPTVTAQQVTAPTAQVAPVQPPAVVAPQQITPAQPTPAPVAAPPEAVQAPVVAPEVQAFEAIVKQAEPTLRRNIEAISRKIFGQNVGAESAIGRENVNRLLEEQASFFAPTLEKLSAQGAQRFIEEQSVNTQRVFDLVQTGQITGDQAVDGLKSVGINPENFQTPEQVQDSRDMKQLEEFRAQFGPEDQELADTIDTLAEAQFFERTGKTIEQNILDIVEESKTEAAFKEKLPELRKVKAEAEEMLNREIARSPGWIGFPPTVEELERSVAAAQLRVDQIDELIASRGRD